MITIRSLTQTSHTSSPMGTHRILGRQCLCGASPGPCGECVACRHERHLKGPVQATLFVGQPGDPYEREADRIADSITPASSQSPGQEAAGNILQTAPAESQGMTTGAIGAAPASVHDVLSSPGRPLPATTLATMEPRFGRDFSQVRVHTGDQAADSAHAVDARAYTVGRDIVFGPGQYAPGTVAGQRLLAHELTHVVQQMGMPTQGPVLQRESPEESYLKPISDEENAAMLAELGCDFRTLCRLRRTHPDIVTQDQLDRATRTCFPDRPDYMPCLFTDVFIHPLDPSVLLPPASSPAAQSGTTPAPVPASGSSIGDLLKFTFSAGPVDFTIDLPKSLTVKLPIPISSAYALEIATSAESSGVFSLSIKLDNKPYFSLSLKAGVDVGKETASAGLIFTTKRTVCRALPQESIRKEMESAGKKIEGAVTELQSKGDTLTGMDRTLKLADIASGIGALYSAIEKTEEACTQVPLVEFGFKAETFYGERSTDPAALSQQPSDFLGPSLKFYIPGT